MLTQVPCCPSVQLHTEGSGQTDKSQLQKWVTHLPETFSLGKHTVGLHAGIGSRLLVSAAHLLYLGTQVGNGSPCSAHMELSVLGERPSPLGKGETLRKRHGPPDTLS